MKISIYRMDYNEELLYIGSTLNYEKRKKSHLSKCYNANSKGYKLKIYKHIRDNHIPWDMVKFSIIVEMDVKDKIARFRLEDIFIVSFKPPFNSRRAKHSKKEYRDEHKEKISETNRKYREEHKEEIAEYMKEYGIKNHKKRCDYCKTRYQAKKEEINEKRKRKETCECGSVYRHDCKTIHERSKKHQDYINSK